MGKPYGTQPEARLILYHLTSYSLRQNPCPVVFVSLQIGRFLYPSSVFPTFPSNYTSHNFRIAKMPLTLKERYVQYKEPSMFIA
jgi:hypothetical protein